MMVALDQLVARIHDGDRVALGADYSGCAMAAVRALIAGPVSGLRLVGVPQMGFQADMLIGAGKVASVETAAVTLGELGPAPCFSRAVKSGALEIRDATCPALLAGLQAAEKGVPFMPLRGLIGSDLMRVRPDWKLSDNPFANDDPIVLLPAIRPDVTLFHAECADRDGNVWLGVRRELVLSAHASRRTLVTAERICDEDFLADPMRAAGTLPALYVDAIAHVPSGAWPLGLSNCYAADDAHLTDYARAAQTEEGFGAWMRQHVLDERAA